MPHFHDNRKAPPAQVSLTGRVMVEGKPTSIRNLIDSGRAFLMGSELAIVFGGGVISCMWPDDETLAHARKIAAETAA